MPAGDHSAGVNYDQTCYPLTVGHSGNGTTPTVNPSGSDGCASGYYHAGASVNLSEATPDTGWVIESWWGTSDDTSTASTNSLTMPASAHSAGVNYAQTCYVLTLGHTGNGTDPVATPANSAVCVAQAASLMIPNGHLYVYGEPISLSGAVPATGWGIRNWFGTSDNASPANTNSLIMPAAVHEAGVNYGRLLGDVNMDGQVDSTDALIVLRVDAGLPAAAFCPINYGDVNLDGYVNSTDALIILTYDVGLPVGGLLVGLAVGEPVLIAPPAGCAP